MITKRAPAKTPDWVDDLHEVLANPAPRPLSSITPAAKSPPVSIDKTALPPKPTDSGPPLERPALCQEAIVAAKAKGIENLAPAGYLSLTINQILQGADPSICQKFFTNFLKEAGDSSDPVERMLLESFALAHHCAGNWSTCTATARTTADAVAFGNLATKMYGEFRRLALAVKEYRAPAANKLVLVAAEDEQPKMERGAA